MPILSASRLRMHPCGSAALKRCSLLDRACALSRQVDDARDCGVWQRLRFSWLRLSRHLVSEN